MAWEPLTRSTEIQPIESAHRLQGQQLVDMDLIEPKITRPEIVDEFYFGGTWFDASSSDYGVIFESTPTGNPGISFAFHSGDAEPVFEVYWHNFGSSSPGVGVSGGKVGWPGYRFIIDPDTGLWRQGADSMSAVAGGVEMMRWTESGSNSQVLLGMNGSEALPAISRLGNTSTGIWFGTDQVWIGTAGHQRMVFGLTDIIMYDDSATAVEVYRYDDTPAAHLWRVGGDLRFTINPDDYIFYDGTGTNIVHHYDQSAQGGTHIWNDNGGGLRMDMQGTGNFRVYESDHTSIAFRVGATGKIFGSASMSTTTVENTIRWEAATPTYEFLRFTSSARYKKNIRPPSNDFDRADILDLEIKAHDDRSWRNSNPQKNVIGLIAEEVAEKIPWMAMYHDGKIDSYSEQGLTMLMVRELQDLKREVQRLKKG